MSDQVRFGANVRRLRNAQGISQEALADRSGIHRTYLGAVERGERNISLKNICRLISALQCRPEDLFVQVCDAVDSSKA